MKRVLIGAAVLCGLLMGCNTDTPSTGDPANPFVGVWTQDGSGGTVKVEITENTWVSKHNGSLYNSGTYVYSEGSPVTFTVTNKGAGSVNVGGTGTAVITNGKIVVSDFADVNINGTFTRNSIEGTWFSTAPVKNSDYVKAVAANGTMKQFIASSRTSLSWDEIMRCTYPAGASGTVTFTVQQVNLLLFGKLEQWVAYDDLEAQYKAEVAKTYTATVSGNTITFTSMGGVTLESQ